MVMSLHIFKYMEAYKMVKKTGVLKNKIAFLSMASVLLLVGCSDKQTMSEDITFLEPENLIFQSTGPTKGVPISMGSDGILPEGITLFDIYGEYVNENNFQNDLLAFFNGGDSRNLRKKRTFNAGYYLFDQEFKPIKPILAYSAGDYDSYRDRIVTEDTYQAFGEYFVADNYDWANDKIKICLGNFAEYNPTYIFVKIYLTWECETYDKYEQKSLPTPWCLGCSIVFKL